MSSLPAIVIIVLAVVAGLVFLIVWEPFKVLVKALLVGLGIYLVVLVIVFFELHSLPDALILIVMLVIIESASVVIGFLKAK